MKIPQRYFGKNKALTALVMLVAGLLLIGVLVYQVYVQKPTYVTVRIKGSPGNWWWVTPRPPDWLANAVKMGDKEYNAANKAIAEVKSVDIYDAGGSTKDIYVTASLDVRYNAQTKKYRYKGEPLEIGGPISLSLGSTFFPGMVVGIEGADQEPKKYTDIVVQIRYRDRWPYEYDAIKIGETITSGDKNIIAEIVSKERRPSEREVETLSGQVIKGFSPVLDDFYVKLKLRVTSVDDQHVYREEQYVKVGNQLWLLFPSYNISGAYITSIEE